MKGFIISISAFISETEIQSIIDFLSSLVGLVVVIVTLVLKIKEKRGDDDE